LEGEVSVSGETLKAPFPWFGGKSRVADVIWSRFGNVPNYIEPFFGSGAVLLGRPSQFDGVETVNDLDGMVANFWRAVKADPEAVAFHADWPVNENDLHARHAWLVERKESLQSQLEGDPDFCDAKVAGWWCWGICCWIGGRFCSGDGPWQVVEENGVRKLVHLGNPGQGVIRKLVHLGDAGRGVNRQLVHLGPGRGVNRRLVHLGDAGRGVNRKLVHQTRSGIVEWMNALADRLARVRVCCGDWRRVCGGRTGDALKHFFAAGNRCAVFLDPPYADTAERRPNIYNKDCLQVAHDVRRWCIDHGGDERLRICLAGYEGEHDMPDSWECVEWKANGGYASLSDDENVNARKERLWFSPHCLKPKRERRLFE
jgi:hypothetical protein